MQTGKRQALTRKAIESQRHADVERAKLDGYLTFRRMTKDPSTEQFGIAFNLWRRHCFANHLPLIVVRYNQKQYAYITLDARTLGSVRQCPLLDLQVTIDRVPEGRVVEALASVYATLNSFLPLVNRCSPDSPAVTS